MTTTTLRSPLAGSGPVDVTVDERGQGRPFLLLHGGGGPLTVAGFAELLAVQGGARVLHAQPIPASAAHRARTG